MAKTKLNPKLKGQKEKLGLLGGGLDFVKDQGLKQNKKDSFAITFEQGWTAG